MDIKVGNKLIGPRYPMYVMAEAGVNHNGSLSRAIDLIREAAKAGADAIKFQTYSAEKLVTKSAPRFWEWAEAGKREEGGTQFDSYAAMDMGHFPLHFYPALIEACREHEIEFVSTPFDEDSADALVAMGMRAIKVSSSDLTNLPFLSHLAKHQLPIFLSTGAATIGEIEEAVSVIEKEGNRQIIIMHCTLLYPTPAEHANLRVIQTLAKIFPDYPIGLSDHTIGIDIPPASVALGATMVEKHYTIDKSLPTSPDHWLSVDPTDLQRMVEAIRTVERALGTERKFVLPVEEHTYKYDKRSLVAAINIPAGVTITRDMLTHKRPGTGIRPKYFDIVVGRTAKRDIKEDTTLTWDMI